MRNAKYLVLGLVMFGAFAMVGCDRKRDDDGRPVLLLSMKGQSGGNPFWASVEEGAREAARAGGASLVVLGPRDETDVEGQIAQIEDQITRGVDAILVAPTDVAGLVPTLERARAAGIPVLLVDTDAPWPHKMAFVGTDNRRGGEVAAAHLCTQLPRGSKVALITGVMSQQTHIDRVAGALSALQACGLVVAAEQPANSDRALGQSVMENLLTAHADLRGVFATNDMMALGALEAAREMGKLDELVVVGFDANPEAVAAIAAGDMSASVAQDPLAMGRQAVVGALRHLNGETVPKTIDTGSKLVTRESVPAR